MEETSQNRQNSPLVTYYTDRCDGNIRMGPVLGLQPCKGPLVQLTTPPKWYPGRSRLGCTDCGRVYQFSGGVQWEALTQLYRYSPAKVQGMAIRPVVSRDSKWRRAMGDV